MSTLSKIRNNIGLVIALIVISLAAFILTDFFTGKTRGIGQGNNVAGEVSGEEIPVQAINDRVDNYSRGRQDQSKEQVDQLQRDVWNEVVREVINGKEFSSVGMQVTEREESMLYFGPITHPYVFQFPWFRDSLGQFSPDMIRQRFQQADQITAAGAQNDVELNFVLDMQNLKKFLRDNRIATKWETMVKGSALVADNEIRRSHVDQQKKVNISYLNVPYVSVPPEQVNVSDADYQEYYDAVKERFKRQTEQVTVKYTYFPLTPSKMDTSEAKLEVEQFKDGFLDAEDIFLFASQSSNIQNLDTSYVSVAALPPALRGVNKSDSVVGPVVSNDGLELYRIVDQRADSAYSVDLRHILVQYKGSTQQDTLDARQTANQIRNQVEANPASFAEVVLEKSDDFGSKAAEGRLGWIDPLAVYGPEFADDVKKASIGRFIVTQSPRGYHVVEVTDRSNMKYSFARLVRTIGISSATDDSVSKRASQYASRVLAGEDMDSLLSEFREARTQVSPPQTPASYALGGLTDGRPVISWAFQAEPGETSDDLIKTDDAFVIGRVLSKGGYDYAPLVEVRDQITLAVQNRVRARIIKEKLATLSGDPASMANAYGQGASTGNAPGLSFSSSAIPGLGSEPKVVGRAFGMTQGQVSQPIAGATGVFVIKVESVTEAPELSDLTFMRSSMLQQKQQQAVQNLSNGMTEIAKIKDYRYLFPNL